MKKLLILLMLVAMCPPAIFSQTITHIENRNNFYHIYNEKNQEIKAISNQIGTLIGHGSNFFIVRNKSSYFYDLYDIQGRKYKSISTSVGDIISILGETFVVKKGNFTSVYNSKGEKIK